jgi:hypothetical protein
MTGDSVKVTRLIHIGEQGFSADEDSMAMVEILLLSFVGELLVTPLSTSGGLAQAYGAIRPWLVDVKGNDQFCVRAQSVDLCYQAFMIFLPVKKECWWLQRHPPSVVPSNVQLASNPTFFDDLGSFGFTF